MAMEFKLVGGSPPAGTLGVVDQEQSIYPSFGAAGISLKPDEFSGVKVGGHYTVSAFTAAAAFAAGGIVAAFRWTDSSLLAGIKRVRVAVNVVTAVTAQAGPDCDMIVARSYTVGDTTNGTAVSLAGSTGKMRGAKMGTSPALIHVASTTGATGGTKALDSSTVGNAPVPLTGFTIGGASPLVTLFDCSQNGQHPLILETNEGFVVRNTTLISTGTIRYYVDIDWLEAPGF